MDQIFNDLPYKAEYARSNRARCKVCNETIEEDELKLASNGPSEQHDGKYWYFNHYDCFFDRYNVDSIIEIKNFEWLKYEDQKRIEKSIDKGKRRKRKYNDYNKEQSNCNEPNGKANDRTENGEIKAKKANIENEDISLKEQSALLYGFIENFKKNKDFKKSCEDVD